MAIAQDIFTIISPENNPMAIGYYFFSLFVLLWLLLEGGYYSRVAFSLLGSWRIATQRRLNKVHAGDTARPNRSW